jgi:hypothetical protein
MTEEVALETDASIPVDADSSDAQPDEMISKRRAEELVKKAKLKGRDSMQAELDALKAENAQLKNSAGSMGGMPVPVDQEAIKEQIMNDLRKQMQDASEKRAQEELDKEAQKIAQTYHGKMSSGKDQFEDFEEVMADFNPAAFPNLVYLASQVDNTPAVMRELMQNPSKLAAVTIMSERDPAAAQRMIAKISSSIVANDQAKAAERDVAQPLNRMSSSPTGKDNGTPNSVRDYKRMFRG